MSALRGMIRNARSVGRGEGGQALVEFALVLPLLLALVIGVFEFGRAWNAYQVLTDAAREGARNAVLADPRVDSTYVVNTIKAALARAALDPAKADIAFPNTFSVLTGEPLAVSIEYPYEFVFLGPLLNWATNRSSITLSTTFVMRAE